MSAHVFKLRVIVAKLEGEHPSIVAGISDDTWGIIDVEEWDQEKRQLLGKWLGPDWTAYDVSEAVLEVPEDALSALFSPPIPVAVSKASS